MERHGQTARLALRWMRCPVECVCAHGAGNIRLGRRSVKSALGWCCVVLVETGSSLSLHEEELHGRALSLSHTDWLHGVFCVLVMRLRRTTRTLKHHPHTHNVDAQHCNTQLAL